MKLWCSSSRAHIVDDVFGRSTRRMDWMDANPTVILGRQNHLIYAEQDDSVLLRVFNMGNVTTSATINEVIPPEFKSIMFPILQRTRVPMMAQQL